MAPLLIPVKGMDEFVEVDPNELPEDAADLIDILKAEFAPLDIWMKVAAEYYRHGKLEQTHDVLHEGAMINEMLSEQGADATLVEEYGKAKSERIAILNALAAYYTQLGAHERDKRKREEFFQKAAANLNMADKIEIREQITWVNKGVLLLARGEMDRAVYSFETALEADSQNVPALLGKACILFNRGTYEEALRLYRQALEANPACPPSVRLGLAHCYHKLGNPAKARQCFERVLELDGESVEALVALAVFDLNSGDLAGIERALAKVKRGYEKNQQHGGVLLHLSNHLFYKGDYARAFALAKQAYSLTALPRPQAEISYSMARAFHAQGKLQEAEQYYANACRLWPDFAPPHYGLAQMRLHRGDLDGAISHLEKVLMAYPDSLETLKALGSLYARKNLNEKALANLKRAAELDGEDAEVQVEIGQLLELSSPTAALAAYDRAAELLARRDPEAGLAAIPGALLNNVAVLLHAILQRAPAGASGARGQLAELVPRLQVLRLLRGSAEVPRGGDHALIEELYRAALAADEGAPGAVTTRYNLARTREEAGEAARAREGYEAIVASHAAYIDPYLRLGAMARARGAVQEAAEWYNKALKVDQASLDAWTMLGSLALHGEREGEKELEEATRRFKRVLQASKHDSYALLAVANVFLAKARRETGKERDEALARAIDFYQRVLSREAGNVYAANGVGAVLAERGRLPDAREVFLQVREATGEVPCVWVNLAHVYLLQGQHINAIKMYGNCLRRFYGGRDPQLLLYLARAYFDAGKFADARTTLQKALHQSPENPALRYNMAVAQHAGAAAVLAQHPKCSTPDLRAALAALDAARGAFKRLSDARGGRELNYDRKRALHLSHQCRLAFDKCRRLLKNAEEAEAAAREGRERERERVEAELAALRAAQAAKQRAAAEAEEELERRLEAQRRKNEEIRERILRESLAQKEEDLDAAADRDERQGKKEARADDKVKYDADFIDDTAARAHARPGPAPAPTAPPRAEGAGGAQGGDDDFRPGFEEFEGSGDDAGPAGAKKRARRPRPAPPTPPADGAGQGKGKKDGEKKEGAKKRGRKEKGEESDGGKKKRKRKEKKEKKGRKAAGASEEESAASSSEESGGEESAPEGPRSGSERGGRPRRTSAASAPPAAADDEEAEAELGAVGEAAAEAEAEAAPARKGGRLRRGQESDDEAEAEAEPEAAPADAEGGAGRAKRRAEEEEGGAGEGAAKRARVDDPDEED